MIKKVLLFVLLMLAGLGVMHFLIGWENFATIRDDEDGGSKIRQETGRTTDFVVGSTSEGDSESSAIRVSARGALTLPRQRALTLPDGSQVLLPTYVLDAKDSRPDPRSDDRMELFDVTVDFYDIDTSDAADPKAIPAGTLVARRAVIQLGRDADGNPSIEEDRDMALEGVVVTAAKESKLAGLVMKVDDVRVRHGDNGITLRTPTDDEPFELTRPGDGTEPDTHVDGLGLRAILPSSDTAFEGARVLEFHVAQNPTFVRGPVTIRAKGRLDYVEDMEVGVGRLELHDEVHADGLVSDDASRPVIATADHLVGTLARRGGPEVARKDRRASWIALRMVGTPAALTGEGARLECGQIDAAPALDGKPAIFTASGEPCLEQPSDDGGPGLRFDAPRIHLVRVRDYLTALHRPFGFTPDMFGRSADELVLFESGSKILDRATDTTVEASRGLRVLRGEGEGAPTLSVGFGDVRIEREGLVATGGQGFQMTSDEAGGGPLQKLRLGPRVTDPLHAFTIREESPGRTPLVVRGRGRCEVVQWREGAGPEGATTEVVIESPLRDLVAELEEGKLRNVAALRALLGADDAIRSFVAEGDPCIVERATNEGLLVGRGSTLRSLEGGERWRLTGTPATVTRGGEDSRLMGAEVDVFEYGQGKQAVVVRRGDKDPATVRIVGKAEDDAAAAPSSGTGPTQPIDVSADQFRLVPFLLPDFVVRAHFGGASLDAPWVQLATHSLRSEVVFADDAVEIREDAPDGTGLHAFGDRFVTRVDGGAGVLFGDPARVDHGAADGRRVRAYADTIRVARGGAGLEVSERGGEQLHLIQTPGRDPRIVFEAAAADAADGDSGLANAPAAAGSSVRRLEVICAGDVDALGGTIDFASPVLVQQLDAADDPVTDGLNLAAARMQLRAAPDGTIRELDAGGSVDLRVRGVHVLGDSLTLNLARSRVSVWRERGFAEVRLPNGKLVRGRRLEVDYIRMLVTGWNIRIVEP